MLSFSGIYQYIPHYTLDIEKGPGIKDKNKSYWNKLWIVVFYAYIFLQTELAENLQDKILIGNSG